MKTQYATISGGYHSHMLNNPASAKDDFVSKCSFSNKEIAILEYGCGSGIDAKYFIDKYPKIKSYVGIDNSNEMLQLFNKTLKISKVKGVLADIDTFIPKENTYDLVFGMYSIHYTNDLKNLMKRIYASLKNGGYFCFRDAHPLVGFFKKTSKKYDEKEIVEFPLAGGGSGITVKHPTFTFQEYINCSTDNGFRIVSLSENMGKQGKELGIEGFIIPTTFTLILKKD